jgi:hypothetical protein
MKRLYYVLLALMLVAGFGLPFSPVYAAPLTSVSDTLSTLTQSVVANHTISFVATSGVVATGTITIVFPDSFASGLNGIAFGDLDMTDNGSEIALAAAASGSTWGVGVATRTITITSDSGSITAGHTVVIEIGTNATTGVQGDTQIVNPAQANDIVISITSGTDSGSLAIATLNPSDTVSVTAQVSPTLTFAISDTTIGFGTLSSGAPRYATGNLAGNAAETEAHTLQASTNADNGYTITVTGYTLSTEASGAGNTITAIGAVNTASDFGTEQFGLRMNASGGDGSVVAPYAAAGFALDTAAFPDQVAQSLVPSDTTTYSVRYIANISGSTEAGSYSTTLTYIATANF